MDQLAAAFPRFMRRWDTIEGVALETPPEDLEAVNAAGEEASSRNSRLLVLMLGLTNLLFWPSDLYNLRGLPEAIRQLGRARVVVSFIFAALYVLLTYVPSIRRHPKGILTIACSAGCFTLGYFFGRLSGPSGPWFHFTNLTMFMPIVCWLTIPERAGGTVLFGVCTIVSYCFVFPEHLADSMALVAISHMGFAVCLSIGSEWILDYLRRESFLMRLAITRQAEQLRRLNGTLESRVQAQAADLRYLAGRLESRGAAVRPSVAESGRSRLPPEGSSGERAP